VDSRVLQSLFFDTSGVVDINSSSPGQLSWEEERGGLMTVAFVDLCSRPLADLDTNKDGKIDWKDELFPRLREATGKAFTAMRQDQLGKLDPASREYDQLEAQTGQAPYAFTELPSLTTGGGTGTIRPEKILSKVVFRESFVDLPPKGWRYTCPHQFIPDRGTRHALRVWGGGHAIWMARLPPSLTLDCRYRSPRGGGIGEIIFVSGSWMYTVILLPDQVVVGYRFTTADGRTREVTHRRNPCRIEPGIWHHVRVRMIGGVIQVSVSEREVVRTTLPRPVPAGEVGVGVLRGPAPVDYGDVMLTLHKPS
jgi:hypothetical protein